MLSASSALGNAQGADDGYADEAEAMILPTCPPFARGYKMARENRKQSWPIKPR